jgi:hypothetical protein
MKTLMRISLAVLLMSVSVISQALPLEEIVTVPTKYKNLFVFKADKEYVGATVEVYYSNGDLVTTHKLEKRKMIIDFCDTKFGEYTIKVVKGDKKQEFYYVKK